MSRMKVIGSIEYNLPLIEDSRDNYVTVHYELIPAESGITHDEYGNPGQSNTPAEIVIDVKDKNGDAVEVDEETANTMINLCFENAEAHDQEGFNDHSNNEYDKYNDD